MKLLLLKKLISAFKGWLFWIWYHNRFINSYEDVVILFPEDEPMLYEAAFLYLDDLLLSRNKKKACILYCSDNINHYYEKQKRLVKSSKKISKAIVDNIMDFYRVMEFSDSFFVASFKLPFGRNGEYFAENNKEHYYLLFALGIYRINAKLICDERQLMHG